MNSATLVSTPSFLTQFSEAVRDAFTRLSPAHQRGLSNPRFDSYLTTLPTDASRIAAIKAAKRKREALVRGPRVYNVGADLLVV